MTRLTEPYRDWLNSVLSGELGVQEADQLIQRAMVRRNWGLAHRIGPREAVAVLQDAYVTLLERLGDARAERWLQGATVSLAALAERVPAPDQVPESGGGAAGATLAPARQTSSKAAIKPLTPPPAWGRRSSDLALILARAQHDVAKQGLDVIRATPDLSALERVAEWNVQASAAEVIRVETEDQFTRMRSDHVKIEVTDEVWLTELRREVLRVVVKRLQADLNMGKDVSATFQHHQLMLEQTHAFLTYFETLTDQRHDPPLPQLGNPDLSLERVTLAVTQHPMVLRARHAYNHALWQTGHAESQAVQAARNHLMATEAQVREQLHVQLDAARKHYEAYRSLRTELRGIESQISQLERARGDELELAELRVISRTQRNTARAQAHRYREAVHVLDALSGASAPL